MRASRHKTLALAARYGRIAYVYIRNGQPRDWALSCKGYKTTGNAASATGAWIAKFDPGLILMW